MPSSRAAPTTFRSCVSCESGGAVSPSPHGCVTRIAPKPASWSLDSAAYVPTSVGCRIESSTTPTVSGGPPGRAGDAEAVAATTAAAAVTSLGAIRQGCRRVTGAMCRYVGPARAHARNGNGTSFGPVWFGG
jgi:hypothetical protein